MLGMEMVVMVVLKESKTLLRQCTYTYIRVRIIRVIRGWRMVVVVVLKESQTFFRLCNAPSVVGVGMECGDGCWGWSWW